uniref:Uncharacterized protein n=1 Tax=Arundo donax TaxID=35708 RepID=A0A0A8ZX53_ARUDO
MHQRALTHPHYRESEKPN